MAWYGPFSGRTHSNIPDTVDDGPANHSGGYGDFVWDLHASCCATPASVYFNVSSPDGVVTGDVTTATDYSDTACASPGAGGCTAHSHTFACGKLVEIDIKVDGVKAGAMQALHFGSINVSTSNNAITTGTKLGVLGNYTTSHTKDINGDGDTDDPGELLFSPCWGDSDGEGLTHIHFGFDQACWNNGFGSVEEKAISSSSLLAVFKKSWTNIGRRACTQAELDSAVSADADNDGVNDSVDSCPNYPGNLPNGCARGDQIKIGNFDDSGDDDIMLARPDGTKFDFYIDTNQNTPHDILFQNWGLTDDTFYAGEFGGDGDEDILLAREVVWNGQPSLQWYFETNRATPEENSMLHWGKPTDQVEIGDFDGDGDDDIMLIRVNGSKFDVYIDTNQSKPHDIDLFQWGEVANGDRIYTGHFGGDGDEDMVLVKPTWVGGVHRLAWYFETNQAKPHDFTMMYWGLAGDTVLIGNFDGVGNDDIMLVRFDGSKFDFWVNTDLSPGDEDDFQNWGVAGDSFHVGHFGGSSAEDIVLIRQRPNDKFDFYFETNLNTGDEGSILNWGCYWGGCVDT